jgi:hypothetical protein
MITRQEAEKLLGNEDGNFLVRESSNPPGSYTLAIVYVYLKLNVLFYSYHS